MLSLSLCEYNFEEERYFPFVLLIICFLYCEITDVNQLLLYLPIFAGVAFLSAGRGLCCCWFASAFAYVVQVFFTVHNLFVVCLFMFLSFVLLNLSS